MTVLSKCVTPYSLTAMSGEIQQPLDGDREVGKLTKMLPRISRDLRMYALPGDEPQ